MELRFVSVPVLLVMTVRKRERKCVCAKLEFTRCKNCCLPILHLLDANVIASV